MLLSRNPEALATIRRPTPEDPLRILTSGCLAGRPVGIDGTDYGLGVRLAAFRELPRVRFFQFCPEDHGIGTPRQMPDLHGGDGRAFWRGEARVLDEDGRDRSADMSRGAEAMLACAREHRVELCILTDSSAACGTQIVYEGYRLKTRNYTRGIGVAAALLDAAGFLVVAQRDDWTLERVREIVEPGYVARADAKDFHESDWYVKEYPDGRTSGDRS
ncbi:MAG: 2-thiouracil desulfurase family protein [Polyangiaceae bacterium]